MLRSFFTAVTGIKSSRGWLDITADNIANANTIGFKKSKPIFQDIVLQDLMQYQPTTGTVSHTNFGGGVTLGYILRDFSLGPFKTTGVNTDIAIEGDGFLILEDNNGVRYYSRDGQLTFASGEKNGKEVMYLVHSSGLRVLGLSYETNNLEPITIDSILDPKATEKIYTQDGSNLDPRGTTPPMDFDLNNAQSFNIVYTVRIYTTDGQTKDVSIYMKKMNPKLYDSNGNHYYTFIAQDDAGNNYFVYLNPNDNSYYKTQLITSTLPSLPANAVLIARDVVFDNYNDKFEVYWYLDNNNKPHVIAKSQNTGNIMEVALDTTNKLTNYQTIEAATVEDYWESFVLLKVNDNEIYNVLNTSTNKVIINPVTGKVDKENNEVYTILHFKDGRIQQEYSTISIDLTQLPKTLQDKILLKEVDLSGLTQYPVEFSLGYNQDGYGAGRFTSLSIGEDGTITALYSNGVSKTIYRLQLAYFRDKQALIPKGSNIYTTLSTIQPLIENAGANAKIRAGTLELSNVDIAEEMINMITAEKAYQANAKVIQTGQTIMDTTINLKR